MKTIRLGGENLPCVSNFVPMFTKKKSLLKIIKKKYNHQLRALKND